MPDVVAVQGEATAAGPVGTGGRVTTIEPVGAAGDGHEDAPIAPGAGDGDQDVPVAPGAGDGDAVAPPPPVADGGPGGVDDIRRLRVAARHDRQQWPFTLVILGLVVVLAAPFYVGGRDRWVFVTGNGVVQASPALGPLASIGPPFTRLGEWAGLYWVVALVAAGLLIAVHDRRSAARRGIAGPLWPAITAGLVLLVVLLALTPRILELFPLASRAQLSTGSLPARQSLYLRGLTPLLLIALVLVVLAWTERSGALAIVAVVQLALALVVNLYDLPNLADYLGLSSPGPDELLPNLLLPGAVLIVTGAGAALRRRVTR